MSQNMLRFLDLVRNQPERFHVFYHYSIANLGINEFGKTDGIKCLPTFDGHQSDCIQSRKFVFNS